ncbi:universal stress protein [Halogeometricum borinquense]|uniref:Universal stress protein n=1 Tax=Halogeometricum borinquense TaxID=60847 RepID=A0A6C0ULV7_9EURY|nr:universal stress protein [Halogeometricum borinquense]QIB75573.1 universal stress protein [Halogeometricum borinquense]
MAKHVLVPVDGSALSWSALRYALGEFPEASITAFHVVDLFEPGYGTYPEFETTYEPLTGSEEWYERAEEVSERLLSEAEAIAGDHDRTVATASEIGDPKRVIVDYSEAEDVDQIVLGAHGRNEEGRAVFGSVAEIVVRRARVTVTLVR